MQTILKYRKQISGYSRLGTMKSKEGWVKMCDEETLGDGGCICCLDCEDAFISVYMCLTHLITF